MTPSSHKDLLHKGEYLAVLDLYEKSSGATSRDLAVASIGALTFLGRLDEAEALFRSASPIFSDAEKSEALFFLVVNLARTQNWQRAREYFRALRSLPKNRKRNAYYRLQASAFLRYTKSQFLSAEVLATQAFSLAVSDGFLYGKVLSADLRGHALVQVDRVKDGIKSLKEASSSAKAMGASSLSQAIQVSTLLYESQFGLRSGSESLGKLRALIKKLDVADSFTRINLHFELVRSLTLAGNYVDAEKELLQVFELIYLFNNPRQETLFKLRHAELSLRRGRHHEALEKILDAKRWSGLAHNPLLKSQILGLEYKIVAALGFKERLALLSTELLDMMKSFPSSLNRRITQRLLGLESPDPAPSSDQIGGLLSRLGDSNREEEYITQVLEGNYLGLLSRLPGIPPSGDTLVWDLERGSLTVFSSTGITHAPSIRSRQSRQLLELLAEGPFTKEALVKKVWGYDYHPIKHDSLLYTAIAQCRKVLGPAAHWIENRENSYGLKAGVRIQWRSKTPVVDATQVQGKTPLSLAKPGLETLNHRQLGCLEAWNKGVFFSVKSYQGEFSVSRNTATRDLRDMESKGLLRAVGSGPSRRYTRHFETANRKP
ncbi:MAG: hypothetical protein ABIR96_08760 [Bdellovibrionota bacterium]